MQLAAYLNMCLANLNASPNCGLIVFGIMCLAWAIAMYAVLMTLLSWKYRIIGAVCGAAFVSVWIASVPVNL